MKASNKRSFCPISTLSILAMSMPTGSHRSQQDYEIDLVGPTRADYKWQAKPQTGFDAGQFQIDWQARTSDLPRRLHE
jgi:hypothetical protein